MVGSATSSGEWGNAEPRWATPRSQRETIAPEVFRIMEPLKISPMPWQRATLERAFEVDDDGTLHYWQIVLIIPRQSGKTTLFIPWGVHRMTAWARPQLLVYVGQSGVDGSEKWLSDIVGPILESPFRRLVPKNRKGEHAPFMSSGHWHLDFINGAQWAVRPPTETAGHGRTVQLGFLDEAFAYKDNRVEQAISPAQVTLADAQTLIASTVGRSKGASPYLWRKVEAGRNIVESGIDSRTLYVEFSAPEDADWLDQDVWRRTLPALGYTQTIDRVIAQTENLGEQQFRRAFLNQWGDDMPTDSKIPQAAWAEVLDEHSQSIGEPTWVLDVSPDQAAASIGMAGDRTDGTFHIEVVDHGQGTDWVIDGDDRSSDDPLHLHGLRELVTRWGGTVWCDAVTVGGLLPRLQEAGINVRPIPSSEVRLAAGGLLDAVLNTKVHHIGQTELDTALAAAGTRKIGDGWAWSRGASMQDITALVSVSLALWMHMKTAPDRNYDPLKGVF